LLIKEICKYMSPFLLALVIAQTTPAISEIIQTQQVRPLPGKLDSVPVFNSNSPEKVVTPGILLSTFPSTGKKNPNAHLNFPFSGRFDVFAHHVFAAPTPEDQKSLYLGVLLHNPGKTPITVKVLQAASYLSQPDAPFIELPTLTANPQGKVYAGPGSRVMNEILRRQRQAIFPGQIVIQPGQSQMLLNAPIPVEGLTPPLNGRSTYARLQSDGKVYAASLAMMAPTNSDGSERPPTVAEWENLLENGDLSSPRDKIPTPLEQNSPRIYGRVAGVAQGSRWRSLITDNNQVKYLTIPQPGQVYSYGISTLHGGTLGTNQIQSAPMLARYPDTAYLAHGNYGVEYNLRLPLYNDTSQSQSVSVSIQTPIKEEKLTGKGLRFLANPVNSTSFRGTVRVAYRDEQGKIQSRYIHLVQKRGQSGEPLAKFNLPPGGRKWVQVDLIYPPDATPPQVLTVATDGK
jgi:Protein of unknown function (DUF3370)